MGQQLDPESAPSQLRLSTKNPDARIEIACPDAHYVKIHDTGTTAGRSAYFGLVAKVAVAVADAGSADAGKAVTRCMSSAVRTPHPVGKIGSTRAREIAKIPYFRGRVELGAFELVCHYETRKIDDLEFDLYPLN